MTFTYVVTTDLGKLRLILGDTGSASAEFSDEEMNAFIAMAGTWQQAAIMGCDALIAKYARLVNLTLGPRSESYSDIVAHYKDLKASLLAGGGVAAQITTEGLTFSWNEDDDDDTDYYEVTD
jgi:hypothetical protein